MEYEKKSFNAQTSVEDEEKGIVHAVVSVFNNTDHDGDVLVKGAFQRSIQDAKSKGKFPPAVYMHDWSLPVAKTLDMWEEEDGLHVVGQFALYKQIGQDTYNDIKHGLITEYSFGFQSLRDEQKSNGRHILDVKMYEWSPVLYGANSETRTVGVKGEAPALTLDTHFEKALAAVSNLLERVEGLAELRAQEGRNFNAKRREQLAEMQGKVNALLTATKPMASEDEIKRLLMEIEITRAHLNGVA